MDLGSGNQTGATVLLSQNVLMFGSIIEFWMWSQYTVYVMLCCWNLLGKLGAVLFFFIYFFSLILLLSTPLWTVFPKTKCTSHWYYEPPTPDNIQLHQLRVLHPLKRKGNLLTEMAFCFNSPASTSVITFNTMQHHAVLPSQKSRHGECWWVHVPWLKGK